MHIEDFESESVLVGESEKNSCDVRVRVSGDDEHDVVWDPKRVLIGAGARFLFYPTLVYNVVRNKVQTEFRWWDRIGQFVLLGAVPFPSDVLRLKELGVHGVITLNEPYETLVPTSLYHAHGIYHLVLPTRDYLFAPSMNDICQAVDFIHRNASRGWTTYVHCKAGRGRSTTIVLCYLVQHKQMTPEDAYSYVRSIRPRVQLASSQWQAVKDYYNCKVKSCDSNPSNSLIIRSSGLESLGNLFEFDDCSVVVVTNSDLDGYDPSQPSVKDSQILADLSVIYKARVAGQAALARLSCLWLRCHTQQKIAEEQLLRQGSCTIRADQISGSLTVDIHVY
ncbi:phosphatidylglycerophosphate phosphatase PTPMT1 [Beta vulgaris subsp. vulgaris]|uniref:phosphatidylglycerophosphate phosphatase PTPMT1 n=1 Tax=Beta vulgaris subsp. vulgaris TaxID=3555 RepID=UPI0020376734|nr:phosphatidylglycerophosphate phosphatase PTPMT1 [Beta vulgaris subsp. vulgaris]